MKNEIRAWVVGGALFALIAGIWVWQLPNIIRHANGGRDIGLGGIVASMSGTGREIAPSLTKVRDQLDAGIKNMDQAVGASAAASAPNVVGKLKQNVMEENAKSKIKAALTNANTNANQPLKTDHQ